MLESLSFLEAGVAAVASAVAEAAGSAKAGGGDGDGTSEGGVGAAAEIERGGKALTPPVVVVVAVMADGILAAPGASTKIGGVCVPTVLRATSTSVIVPSCLAVVEIVLKERNQKGVYKCGLCL